MLPSGKFPRFALFAAILAVFVLLYDLEFVHQLFTRLLLSNCLDSAVMLLAAVCCFYVAFRSSGYARQVWLLLAIAISIESIGQGISTYYQSFVPGSSLAPEPSDLFFFAWAAPVFMILLPRSEEQSSSFDPLRLLDFLQIAIVAVTAYLYFFYFTARWKSDQISLVRGILFLYIARDLLLSLGFFFRSRSSVPSWFRRFAVVLTLAFLLQVATHADYLVTLAAATGDASWGDLLAMLPYSLIIGLAVFWREPEPDGFPASASRVGNLFTTQFFPLVMPLLVIFMARAIAPDHALLAWLTLGASVLCSSIRLILTNRRERRISVNLLTTEKALQSSQQLLSVAFFNSPDGFSISGFPNGEYVQVNDGFTRLTGYTREESLGRTPLELNLWVYPPSRQIVLTALQEHGVLRNFEMRFRTKTGEIRDGLLSGTVVNLDGRQHALICVRDISEIKAAELAIRTSEERFRSLVNNLHVGIITSDAEGHVLFANQAVLKMFDAREEDVLGKTVYDLGLLTLGEDGAALPDDQRPILSAIRSGQPRFNQVMGLRHPDNQKVVWTVVDVVPESDSQGRITRFLISITDITEQRRATEALRENEERFRAFVENLHVGIVSCTPNAEVLYANPAALQMFGLKLDHVLGKTPYGLGIEPLREDGSVLPDAEGLIPTVVATRQPINSRVLGWRYLQSQKIVWTLLDAVPQLNASGDVASILLSLTNLTEQRRASDALRESEDRFRTLVNNLQAAVVLHGLDGTLEYVNPAAKRMLKFPEDIEVHGKLPADFGVVTLGEDARELPEDARPVVRVLRTHSPVVNVNVGFRHPHSQEILWVFGSSVPRFDAHGNFRGVISSFTDLTEQRRASDALRESEERFRTLVRDLHVGVVLHNPDGTVQFANRAALAMYGHTAQEIQDKTAAVLGWTAIDVNGRAIPFDRLPAETVIRTKLPVRNNVIGWRHPETKDTLWIFGNAVPQYAPDGSILRVITSFSDITEMKNAERSIHQLSTELLKLQDEERRRIGRELHDGMAQTVLAVNLSLAQLRQSGQPLTDASKRALDKARDLLQQMSREIRTLSYLLHPPLLDDLGLVTALKEYVNGFSERSDITTTLELPSRFRRLPQMVETAFFRITQESLSNIQRHSGSKIAKVSLREDAESVTLEITDYGHGMASGNGGPLRPPRLGVGIPGMRERMAQLGGYLDIESDSHGTTVRARMLLSAPALNEALHESSSTIHRG